MGAPKGNQFYKLRSVSGRGLIFETPEDLMNEANAYFEWCTNNPLQESTLVKFKDYAELTDVPRLRVFTLAGLCIFADIMVQTFHNYEANKDFLEVCTRIRSIIANQKYEGAASGFFKENLIARDLGIADKQEIKTGKNFPEWLDED